MSNNIDTEKRTLSMFTGDTPEPIIKPGKPYIRPHHETGENTAVGNYAESNRGRAYLSARTRTEHFYRKKAAYCLSTDLIHALDADGIDVVFIAESDTGTMFEYTTAQFLGPDSFPLNHDDHQRGVPVAEAVVWTADEVTIA